MRKTTFAMQLKKLIFLVTSSCDELMTCNDWTSVP